MQALKEKEPPEAIELRIEEYVSTHSNIKTGKSGLKTIIDGYVLYFRNRGLV